MITKCIFTEAIVKINMYLYIYSFVFIIPTLQRTLCYIDIDDCSNDTLNDCSDNSACENIPGSYQCHCNYGFTGNGINCTGNNN